MKKILFCIALLSTFQTWGQAISESFEGNNFRWSEATSGELFHVPTMASPGLEVPINSENHIIYAHEFWIGGYNSTDELRLSATRTNFEVFDDSCSYSPGPVKLDGTVDTSQAFVDKYNRFWYVTRDQIDQNTAYFDCLDEAGCNTEDLFPEGYEIPEAFLSWPAHEDSFEGYAENIAPFYDRNGDGVYDPQTGDHPLICGDFEVYSIVNDVQNFCEETGNTPLKIELHTAVYGYNSEDAALFNTLFVKRKIMNRSEEDYHDVYIGLWTEFDLGNYQDDRVGTDVARNMTYVFNGDVFDEGSQFGPGYGELPPAAGLILLRGPLLPPDNTDNSKLFPGYEVYAQQGTGWQDGLIDNERIGMSSSLFHYNSQANDGDPVSAMEFYNYMEGLTRDGSPFYYGIGGSDSADTGIPSHYFYPGISDPLMAGTNGVDPDYPDTTGWTEISQELPPGDRRMLTSTGPFNLDAGENQIIDYAIIYAAESDNGETDVLDTLRSHADAIRNQACDESSGESTAVSDVATEQQEVRLFPNPTSDNLFIHFDAPQENLKISVYDIRGRLQKTENVPTAREIRFDLNDMVKGIYILRLKTDALSVSRRVVIN